VQNMYTALHRSANGGHVEVIRALLNGNANLDLMDKVISIKF
jgi:ankyrin repeat protein